MPAQLTYPGVYVEEIPSGVRTIVGVPTAVTAFLGRAPKGPTNEPTTLFGFGDFERVFGALDPSYPLGYAVKDFFVNGGGQALVVRLYKAAAAAGGAGDGAPAEASPDVGRAATKVGDLPLVAASPGEWGNVLAVEVNRTGIDDDVAGRFGLAPADKNKLFNLVVWYDPPNMGPRETIRNVTVSEGPRRVDRVLESESQYVRVGRKADRTPNLPANAPDDAPFDPDPKKVKLFDAKGANSGKLASKADYEGKEADKTGLYALLKADIFNLLCIPPDDADGDTSKDVYDVAAAFCELRRAMLIIDPPRGWTRGDHSVGDGVRNNAAKALTDDLGITGTKARNAAVYFPRLLESDPKRGDQVFAFPPCGALAGIMSRTDSQRGVWKAPAGLDAGLAGIRGLDVVLSDDENGTLNQVGINCLRSFPIAGPVVWGARTLRGADQLADEYKYVPVRRLALFIEESLYRGTQWVVFEPNDNPLWAQIRLNVGAFMHNLFRQGAFQGNTPSKAYFVKCDGETTTQNDINLGIVNILVGFAPLKPAEFVVLKLQQMAGQIET